MKKRMISLTLVLCLLFSSVPAVFAEETVVEGIDLDLIETILTTVESYYKYDITREELIEGMYKGITSVLDQHSKYFTKKEYADFMGDLDGSLIGIGVYVEEYENLIKVVSPIEGSPAYKAGIQTGDIITHVDDIDIIDISFENAIDMIKGIEDTEVKITLNRSGKTIDFYIIRELIIIKDVEYKILDGDIGYIRVKQFGSSVSKQFDEAVLELQNLGMTSIVVDLRNNPGGYLDEVIKIADWFVDINDPIVHIDYKTFLDEDYYGKKEALNIPTSVLINGGSASASEILAGAIQNNEEGSLVGTLSYGKGTVQNIIALENHGGLKLTTAEYLTAGKVEINNIGVTPDYIVESNIEDKLNIIENFVPLNETKKIILGNIGLNTYGYQQRLNFLGYNLIVDGMFGDNTFNALVDFQKNRNIPDTGYFDEVTIKEIAIAVEEQLTDDIQLKKAIELLK